jgi:hypothetical protein
MRGWLVGSRAGLDRAPRQDDVRAHTECDDAAGAAACVSRCAGIAGQGNRVPLRALAQVVADDIIILIAVHLPVHTAPGCS